MEVHCANQGRTTVASGWEDHMELDSQKKSHSGLQKYKYNVCSCKCVQLGVQWLIEGGWTTEQWLIQRVDLGLLP